MVLRTQSVMLPDNFTVYYSLHASVLSLSMSGCRPSVFQALAFLASGPTGSGSRGVLAGSPLRVRFSFS
jgi:hypothetical protein